ncbi:alpha/beta fold hydrolase [Aquabacterium sp. OR-4]|uniref:alpha/beta fold hydrolase n=1 Tax=Aquabacterium sp. OR-4 TaxID=2978127 RepID=UPI0021B28CB6|nr:alpha/beta hydrolase [Aquabacterium sp. OR-4]MDT7838545.1 alpha/beta hydrolase [Aquabacterium sp. OR-4]
MSAQPALITLDAGGLRLAAWEWFAAQRGAAPTLLFVHATGFHGRVWDQVIHRLGARLPAPRHIVALELRGHGRSALPTHLPGGRPFDGWADFGRDLAHAAQALGLQGALGIGHSMGAHSLLQAAAHVPACFAALLAIDPVLFEPAAYHRLDAFDPQAAARHPAAARKNLFSSPQAMVERFATRQPYALFDPQALRDYCQHGLKPLPDGQGYSLCCAPLTEAMVYSSAAYNPGIYASLRALQMPVQVVRVRDRDPAIQPFDPLGSPTWAGLVGELRQGRELHLPDHHHLLPMEDPALVAGLVAQLLHEMR